MLPARLRLGFYGLITRMSPIPKPDGWVRGQPFLRDMVCRFHGVVDRDANSAVFLTLEGECVALTGQSQPFTRARTTRPFAGACLAPACRVPAPGTSCRSKHARPSCLVLASLRVQLNAAHGCSADVDLDQPDEAG